MEDIVWSTLSQPTHNQPVGNRSKLQVVFVAHVWVVLTALWRPTEITLLSHIGWCLWGQRFGVREPVGDSHSIFFFFWYIYWLCYYICPISAPSLHSILPNPSLPHSPPIVHVHGSYFGFYISYTILTLPLSIFHLSSMLFILCTFPPSLPLPIHYW